MKFYTEYLTFHTKKRRDYIHITSKIKKVVRTSKIREGMALVSTMWLNTSHSFYKILL
jgi:thiamine phosphate synthase YjbQ (UPF0047 family)